MKKNFIVFTNIFILILLLFVFSGCSTKPVYVSKKEIKEIVKANYGNDYKIVKEKSYEDNTSEKNLIYEYVFENSKGNSFSIYSHTGHTMFDASETFFYESFLRDNYVEKN